MFWLEIIKLESAQIFLSKTISCKSSSRIMATDIGTKAGTFLTGQNTVRLFLGLLVGKNLEVELSSWPLHSFSISQETSAQVNLRFEITRDIQQ